MAQSDDELGLTEVGVPGPGAKKAVKAAGEPLLLVCPIRGLLKKVGKKSSDLSSLEERHRIDAVRHLLLERVHDRIRDILTAMPAASDAVRASVAEPLGLTA